MEEVQRKQTGYKGERRQDLLGEAMLGDIETSFLHFVGHAHADGQADGQEERARRGASPGSTVCDISVGHQDEAGVEIGTYQAMIARDPTTWTPN
eukprot:3249523-Rhodomonas_salina.3